MSTTRPISFDAEPFPYAQFRTTFSRYIQSAAKMTKATDQIELISTLVQHFFELPAGYLYLYRSHIKASIDFLPPYIIQRYYAAAIQNQNMCLAHLFLNKIKHGTLENYKFVAKTYVQLNKKYTKEQYFLMRDMYLNDINYPGIISLLENKKHRKRLYQFISESTFQTLHAFYFTTSSHYLALGQFADAYKLAFHLPHSEVLSMLVQRIFIRHTNYIKPHATIGLNHQETSLSEDPSEAILARQVSTAMEQRLFRNRLVPFESLPDGTSIIK